MVTGNHTAGGARLVVVIKVKFVAQPGQENVIWSPPGLRLGVNCGGACGVALAGREFGPSPFTLKVETT